MMRKFDFFSEKINFIRIMTTNTDDTNSDDLNCSVSSSIYIDIVLVIYLSVYVWVSEGVCLVVVDV